MSSILRRIQRQVSPSHPVWKIGLDGKKSKSSNPPRKIFYNGRGQRLGVNNPKDKALLARLKREARRQMGRAI